MDVPKTFPLWKLPDVPRKLVFQQMDIQDLLDLSMTSRPVKRFLTAYKTHTIQLFWEFGENRRRSRLALMVKSLDDPPTRYMRLSLHFVNVADDNVTFYGIFNFFIVQSRNVGRGIERTVNGERALRMNRRHNKEGFIVAGRENRNESDPGAPDMKFMESLSKHVKDIFFIDKYILRYYASMKDFNLFDSFIWNITRTFGELSIEKEYAEVPILKIDEENIKFLFNKLNVTNMKLEVKSALSRIVSGLVLNQKNLNIYYSCNWLDMNDVINSTSQKIHVHFTRIIEVDELINLVKQWKSGEKLKNMNSLIMQMMIEEKEEEDDDDDEEGEAEEGVDEVEDSEDEEENDENEKRQKE
ncbi:hypothetical protein CRE_30174 [Caenorhabditis remanei]|uniref:Uncharacterized protein n=1 Tax=Caenorhabditis remanei TaxID=31234 RepID=E3NE31_CAERE|nr:hypothetical protein CRE_30174 [Caenorhabditis remanei]